MQYEKWMYDLPSKHNLSNFPSEFMMLHVSSSCSVEFFRREHSIWVAFCLRMYVESTTA